METLNHIWEREVIKIHIFQIQTHILDFVRNMLFCLCTATWQQNKCLPFLALAWECLCCSPWKLSSQIRLQSFLLYICTPLWRSLKRNKITEVSIKRYRLYMVVVRVMIVTHCLILFFCLQKILNRNVWIFDQKKCWHRATEIWVTLKSLDR